MRTSVLSTLLYGTVFLTGAAVLILEVSAVRLLAPHFGASLYVLSSVLTVILAALALGYYVGGRLADRVPSPYALYTIIGTGGALMAGLYYASLYLFPVAAPILGITVGPLFLSLLIFFLPAFLLGIDSPFVVKLLSLNTSSDQTGTIAGTTFFYSTIGSIMGSLLCGFYFIPYWGISLTITTVSLVLVAGSLVATLFLMRFFTTLHPLSHKQAMAVSLYHGTLLFSVVLLAIAIRNFATPPLPNTMLIHEEDGYYSRLQVLERTIDGNRYRILRNDTNASTIIALGTTTPVSAYVQFSDIYTDLGISPQRYLVLGAGAYAIPRHIAAHSPSTFIEVAEIEPKLPRLSEQYFELTPTPQIQTHVLDARVFLEHSTTTYDVIYSDVMNGGHFIPPHLSTVEFYELLKAALSPEGVAFVNFIGALGQPVPNLTDTMRATIAKVFPNHQLYAITGPDSPRIQNLIFILRHVGQPITPNQDRIIKNVFTGKNAPLGDLQVTTSTPSVTHLFYDDRAAVEPLLYKQEAYANRLP